MDMGKYWLVNFCHKSTICNRVLSYDGTVLLLSFSLKISQALANSMEGKHNIDFKLFSAQQKQGKTKA